MKRFILLSFILLALAYFLESCNKDSGFENRKSSTPALPEQMFHYTDNLAGYATKGLFADNPVNAVTDAGATLGRVLFYDAKLSFNNTTACASCHNQRSAFSDANRFSEGFAFGNTKRNSPGFNNLSTQTAYFWDMRANTLEQQVLMPIENHVEMGFNNLNNLPAKLSAVSYYPALFKAAFGSEEITLEKISKALAQFLRAIVSHNSKYDQGVDQNFANFTPLENLGRNLFSQKLCDHCHGGSNFSMNWSTEGVNIGLDMNYNDNGVGVTQTNTALNGCFKVPSLRNIALSAPYMHDGRFQKLEDVIDFYNSNVQPHANLNFRLREGYNNSFINTIDPPIGIPIDPVFFNFGSSNPRRLNLSSLDKQALVAFLKTLTDYSVTTDPKFSDPFFK